MLDFFDENPDEFIVYVKNNLQSVNFKNENEIYDWFKIAEDLK